MIQLYYKTVSKGGKPSYHALTPDPSGAESYGVTDEQAITIAVSLASMAAMQVTKYLPPHKKVSRDIDKMLNEAISILKGCGKQIDPELVDHMAASWNMAMMIAQLTDYEREAA